MSFSEHREINKGNKICIPKAISVIKEEVLGFGFPQVQLCVLTPQDYFIPKHDLVEGLKGSSSFINT